MTTVTKQSTSESLHARIPQEVLENIDRLAYSFGRSRNWVFNEALKQYLEVQKWQVVLIKERLGIAQNPKTKFTSHTEVIRRRKKYLEEKLGL